jgi:uncharacterized protein (TIGR02246 family)
MRRLSTLLLLPLAVVLSACAPSAPPPAAAAADTTADVAAVGRVRSEYEAAVNAGDAARVAAVYTADGITMPNHRPLVSGRDAILAYQQELMSTMTPALTLTAAETQVMGDWAYDRGSYRLTVTPKAAGGTPVTDEGKYLVLLQKQTDGSWKLARGSSNSDLPMPEAALPAADSGMPRAPAFGR